MVTRADVTDPVHRNRPAPMPGTPPWDPRTPLSAGFRQAVEERLLAFVDGQAADAAALGPELAPVVAAARGLVVGGKRLRPAFCYWSYVAAAGAGEQTEAVLAAAASLELLHLSALVHDDVMDASDTRRGRPAAHRQFETLHRRQEWAGDPVAFGRAGAILLGDLFVMWSAEMMQTCGMPPERHAPALRLLERMRTEVTCGQYLDIVAQARPLDPRSPGAPGRDPAQWLSDATRVVEYKSARYTVQRPCQIGAALGGAGDDVLTALAAYGSPLGRAFQFRDDLLGVFGDPGVTGKPSGDDLREGKRTVLVAHALARSGPTGRHALVSLLGDPALDDAGIAVLQDVIATCGAREAVEAMIADGHDAAVAALSGADLTDSGRAALTALADLAVHRDA